LLFIFSDALPYDVSFSQNTQRYRQTDRQTDRRHENSPSKLMQQYNRLKTAHYFTAFSVAGARVWNALPADVTSAPSLFTLRKRLKLHLFSLSYPGRVH